MSTVLIRLLTLNAENVIPEVIWALAGIYAVALLVTLTSVWAVCKSYSARFLWMIVVVCIPFLGIMAHCFRCLTLADLSSLKQFGLFTKKPA